MRLHEFENLWARREELTPQQREELDHFLQQDRFARAFVRREGRLRKLLNGIEGETAPDGFAYRMRVYAANHRDEDQPIPSERNAWLRWPAVSMGFVAGALVVFFAFGPMLSQNSGVPTRGVAERESAQGVSASETEGTAPAAVVSEEDLAENSDSLAAKERTQDRGPRAQESMPDWNLHTVSTGDK